MYICNFCSKEYVNKYNMNRHILNNRCSFENINDREKAVLINDRLNNIKNNTNKNINNVINNKNNYNITNIIVNPINQLDTCVIDNNLMKNLIDEYSVSNQDYLYSNYLSKCISNSSIPQNNSIKYIKKHPPTFLLIINEDGNLKNTIKNLNDTCEMCAEPILNTLKKKIKDCLKEFKTDEEFLDNWVSVKNDLLKELNKETVKRALKVVLTTDILNDISMKLSN